MPFDAAKSPSEVATTNTPSVPNTALLRIPGAHIHLDTPVPIPNTAVKQMEAMIVLSARK